MLAGFTGYEIISRVPGFLAYTFNVRIKLRPRNRLVGAMIALGIAETPTEQFIGFIAVCLEQEKQ
ncbi:MAG: hypothetical protein Ct9H300mP22_7200 [Gammaproteobacteria bacterium]|nr:MAG: hypothetical protein Ct9H300mP22_7200 [Gammaproteobacteria bacterium]